jgi:hypothetical protein
MMLGSLVKCKWSDGDAICMIIAVEERPFYKIYQIFDFEMEEYYWVDEEDLEKV